MFNNCQIAQPLIELTCKKHSLLLLTFSDLNLLQNCLLFIKHMSSCPIKFLISVTHAPSDVILAHLHFWNRFKLKPLTILVHTGMTHFFDRTINLWPSVIQAIQVTCYNVNKLLYADGTVQVAENAGLHQMLNIVVREMHKERNKKKCLWIWRKQKQCLY